MSEKKLRKWWVICWCIVLSMDIGLLIFQDHDTLAYQLILKCIIGLFVWYRVILLRKWAILLYPIISIPFMSMIGILQIISIDPYEFSSRITMWSPLYIFYGVFVYLSWELMSCNRFLYENPGAIIIEKKEKD